MSDTIMGKVKEDRNRKIPVVGKEKNSRDKKK
jgi:hypothetical protein